MSVTIDTARTALQQGDTAQAISLLEQAIAHSPDDYESHALLGAAYSQAERHNDALHALTQAVTLQPANPQARFNLAIAFERAGWKDHALAGLQQAVTLKPDYVQARQEMMRLQQGLAPPPPSAPTITPTFQNALPPQTGYNSMSGYGASHSGLSASGLPPHPTY